VKKHEKKLLVRSVVALILMLVFGFIAVYLEARTGVVKEELLLEHLKGNPQSVTIETFGTLSKWLLIVLRVIFVTCFAYFLGSITRFIKIKFLNGGRK